MTQYKTPGVYVEEISKFPPSVTGVSTAIPAFIGYTEKQPKVNIPQRISSLIEYESIFGTAPTLTVDEAGTIQNKEFVMYDSMRLFFDNGGSVCYVSSIGISEDAEAKKTDLDTYKTAIDKLEEIDEITLLLFPDTAMLLEENGLSTVQQAALAHCGKMKDRFAILDVTDVQKFRDNIGINNLCYGAAYYPFLKTSYTKEFGFKSVINYMKKDDFRPTSDIEALLSLKEDNAQLKIKAKIPAIEGYREALAEMQEEVCIIPPSSAIAGVIVATDAKAGVWQAPANVSLASVKDVTKFITDTNQENLNIDTEAGKSINAIRKFTGKGILVWGARTLDGNSSEWRYIPVRRLFNYIEESLQKSTAWAVFQPNDANTWVKLQCQIENFLSNLWRDGALAGSTQEKAFYVSVGLNATMTAQDILDGNLIIEIGIAAIRPAEFIVLKFSHKVQE